MGVNLYSFGQDVIVKLDGEEIESKVLEITPESIKYKLFDFQDGPLRNISKEQVALIIYENGTRENFSKIEVSNELKNISLEETKAFIVEYINKYGYEEDTFKRPYKATFEGNYLRLVVLRRNGVDPVNDGLLYDFSNVYKFQRVSKRSDKLAFINIFVSILKNDRKDKWDKHKLVMRVSGIPEAESIVNALKHLNSLLLEKDAVDAKF
ncbi:hypothetical protein BKM32_15215 [Mangrovimonas sp. DI 80]|nr:hypothetical protein BKM32_15215 [Mangrovimonas sp. DI 80]